jgi:uncharacterized membrane protein
VIHWVVYASFAIVLWGVNGLFMKLGTNRVSARSMVIWVTAGFLVLVPFMGKATTLPRPQRRRDIRRADRRNG